MNFQKIFILGRATKNAELIEGKSGNFAVFSIAVNKPIVDKKEEGEEKDKNSGVNYYDILCFGEERAKVVEAKVKKGDLIFVEGRPEVDAYTTKEGEVRGIAKVIAESWQHQRLISIKTDPKKSKEK